MPPTPALSLSLAQAVEAALTRAPEHTAVVVVESILHGRRRWHVEIVAHPWVDRFVQHLSDALRTGGAEFRIEVWEQHADAAN